MKDTFDIRKFLTENKLTTFSKLTESHEDEEEESEEGDAVCGTCGEVGNGDDVQKSCSKCGDYNWESKFTNVEEEFTEEEELAEETHMRSLRSLSDGEFEELCDTDSIKIPNAENINGNLIDAIEALLQQELSLHDVAYILGEKQEDLDASSYQDAAIALTDSFEDFKDAIESGWIDGDYDISIITK